ncbi:hypothetical protein P691DRAFT_75479 [Macrolepiota fuliginosa MF-IS2]|uniref:Uncharacterized protein n=1 Tax=Macrolepiota fuliginosa MF-IS2 TaxID=1400762 RepID=A0A9P5XAT8_9AGAR|nr:hypothetical protein P691DRAFT_75479 [Macrolepiota fuliginosa MF-IS2]
MMITLVGIHYILSDKAVVPSIVLVAIYFYAYSTALMGPSVAQLLQNTSTSLLIASTCPKVEGDS